MVVHWHVEFFGANCCLTSMTNYHNEPKRTTTDHNGPQRGYHTRTTTEQLANEHFIKAIVIDNVTLMCEVVS